MENIPTSDDVKSKFDGKFHQAMYAQRFVFMAYVLSFTLVGKSINVVRYVNDYRLYREVLMVLHWLLTTLEDPRILELSCLVHPA